MVISRRHALLAGAGFAALAAPAVRAQTRTIRMWTFLDPAGADPRERALRKIIDAFESANPGTRVSVEPQVWNQMTEKFFAAHRARNAPDVMWVHLDRLPGAIRLESLANLNELFINGWSDAERADLDDVAFRYATTPTARYHIYHSRSYTGIIYRLDLLTEAGIEPAAVADWNAFVPAAERLMSRDGTTVSRWGLGQSFSIDRNVPPIVMNAVLDRQGNLFDDQGRAAWATPAGADGLRFQTDLVRTRRITPEASLSWNVEDLYDQFTAGRMTFMRGSSVRCPRLQSIMGADKVGFMPTPGGTAGRFAPGLMQGWAVGVWSGSAQKELSGRFVEHMSSRESDRIWSVEAGAVPVRKSTVAENAQIFAQPRYRYLAEISNAMTNHGWLVPPIDVSGWEQELLRATQEVFARGAEPAAALERAAAAFNRRHRRS